jgi:hypothetical protein
VLGQRDVLRDAEVQDDEVRFEFSSWWGWILAFEADSTEASQPRYDCPRTADKGPVSETHIVQRGSP